MNWLWRLLGCRGGVTPPSRVDRPNAPPPDRVDPWMETQRAVFGRDVWEDDDLWTGT